MSISYNNLWHRLIDRGMSKTQLRLATGMSAGAFAKLTKCEPVNMATLEKLCLFLDCDIGDIVSFRQEKVEHEKIGGEVS